MILVWGLPGEGPTSAVLGALEQDLSEGRASPVFFLDQRRVLETQIELCVEREPNGFLRVGAESLDLRMVTAAYLRPYDMSLLPAVASAGPSSLEWQHARRVEEALWAWADLTPALVLNPPAAMASNNSKPYQSALIKAHGFRTPETLITTDRGAALEFWERYGEVVFKSISGVRSIVSRLRPEDIDRLDDLATCPTQFQEYVRGQDVRVHVVGTEVFAAEISTTADDYRYAKKQGATVEMRACPLERAVEDRCLSLATALKLPLAGVDLRRSTEGEWYCFEVNPSPAFTFYQSRTGQRIDRAVARMLSARGTHPGN